MKRCKFFCLQIKTINSFKNLLLLLLLLLLFLLLLGSGEKKNNLTKFWHNNGVKIFYADKLLTCYRNAEGQQ